jgi:hypothetical protein
MADEELVRAAMVGELYKLRMQLTHTLESRPVSTLAPVRWKTRFQSLLLRIQQLVPLRHGGGGGGGGALRAGGGAGGPAGWGGGRQRWGCTS